MSSERDNSSHGKNLPRTQAGLDQIARNHQADLEGPLICPLCDGIMQRRFADGEFYFHCRCND